MYALHRAGGVPGRVRSDSLSAAVNNLSSDKQFAQQYEALRADERVGPVQSHQPDAYVTISLRFNNLQ